MATPLIYQGLIPTQTEGGLTPMQLALADYMIKGGRPFGINNEFLGAMMTFASSNFATPLGVDPITGAIKAPDLVRDITGLAYFVRGDDIYLYRRAQDCAMDEERYEEVWLGKVKDLATGTYAYYGRLVASGTVATGGGGSDGGGAYSPVDYGESAFSYAGLQGSQGYDSNGNPTGPSPSDPGGRGGTSFA